VHVQKNLKEYSSSSVVARNIAATKTYLVYLLVTFVLDLLRFFTSAWLWGKKSQLKEK